MSYNDLVKNEKEGIDLTKYTYKSFREQMKECEASGVLIRCDCIRCNQTNLVCSKYGGYCMSGKCRDDRIKPIK